MPVAAGPTTTWMCRFGRHHYRVVTDGNPEKPGASHQECTRCSKTRDPNEYTPSSGTYLAGGGLGGM